jgi:hypothetical protein
MKYSKKIAFWNRTYGDLVADGPAEWHSGPSAERRPDMAAGPTYLYNKTSKTLVNNLFNTKKPPYALRPGGFLEESHFNGQLLLSLIC